MNALAEEFAPHGVGSIFLYTNEAHPGEIYPHLTSMDQKLRHAKDLRDKLAVTRPILVDSLEGDCHRAYGSMPNMAWIFSGAGVPVYKADWTDARSIRSAIVYFVDVANRREGGERLAPFRVQRSDFRERDVEAFYRGLALSGQKAIDEFEAIFGRE